MAPKDESKKPGQPSALASQTPGQTAMQAKKANMPVGFEAIDVKKLKIPQLVLMQDLSPLVKKGRAKPMDLVDNVTDEIISTAGKPIVFIPSFYFRRRVKWIPFDDGGGIECRSNDAVTGDAFGECSKCQFADDWKREKNDKGKIKNEPPTCTLYHCFMGHIEGDMRPVIVDMAKTKEKVAQKILGVVMSQAQKGVLPWKRRWELKPIPETNKAGLQYSNFDFAVLPGEPPAEDQTFSEDVLNMYQSISGKLDMELQKEDFERQSVAEDAGKDGKIS